MMHTLLILKYWLVDYKYMIQGALQSLLYKNPPDHYLEHIVHNKVPVVLIPGILGKWSFMKKIADQISLAGHPVYVVQDLGYNVYNIPESSQKIKSLIKYLLSYTDFVIPELDQGAGHIQKVIDEHKLENIIFLAHSKGGIIGKYFLIHHNKNNTALGMVAIASPFSGSAMAKLVALEPFRELSTDSQIIKDLEEHTEVNNKIVSIIPKYDNHVWAKKGSYLDGAKNIYIEVHGHHKVVFDRKVIEKSMEELERISDQIST
jgi:triacylglycerol lipase